MGGHLSHLEVVENSEVLNSSCGPIRGNIYEHENGKIVDGYLGIPYAKPPGRFERADEAEIWTQVRDCYNYGPKAIQTGLGALGGDAQENTDENHCLTLNVFSPRWKSEHGDRPVMVFIHGGGFELGASANYCHKSVSGSLPLKDVVLVTINYRVGVLGFLTTGQDNCKGNFGLWDQTLALKWVQKHIRSFGGNPDNVTIFGQSAGGASCDLLALSPHSRDLFHKMIPMSGSAFCSWAMRTNENQVKVFEEFAEFIGYKKEQQSLLEFYKSQPAVTLTKIEKFKKSTSGILSFVPNFDGDFFPKCLDELRKEADKKQILIGACEYEGMIMTILDPKFNESGKASLEKNIDINLRDDILQNSKDIQKKVVDQYLNGIDLENEEEVKKRAVHFLGDYIFDFGILESAKNAAKHGNDVFLYSFDFVNPESFGMFQSIIPFPCSSHGTDLRYVLGEGIYSKFEPSEDDLKMFETMTTLFTNFAKTGNAGWEKLDESNNFEKHYQINYPKSQINDVFHDGRWRFFQKIVDLDRAHNKCIYGIDS